jgi:hypothetical protein
MGADQVQALIGKWFQIVGTDVAMGPRPAGRGDYGRELRREERREERHERHEEREARLAAERAAAYRAPYAPPVYVAPPPAWQQPVYPRHHHHHNPHRTEFVTPMIRDHRLGQWQQIVGADGDFQFPPRNALIEAPGPERGGREVLPMSTGVGIQTGQSAQITARPQRVAFRPERVFISASGTAGGASDWIVNDIKIGNRSQFSQSGDVPGDMFANNSIDSFVSFETAQTAMDVVLVVTYVGVNTEGAAFYGAIIGTAAI